MVFPYLSNVSSYLFAKVTQPFNYKVIIKVPQTHAVFPLLVWNILCKCLLDSYTLCTFINFMQFISSLMFNYNPNFRLMLLKYNFYNKIICLIIGMAYIYHTLLLSINVNYVSGFAIWRDKIKINNLKHPYDIIRHLLVVPSFRHTEHSTRCILLGSSVRFHGIQASPICHHKDIVKMDPSNM